MPLKRKGRERGEIVTLHNKNGTGQRHTSAPLDHAF